MYVSINKKWFEANKEKFAKTADSDEDYVISSEVITENDLEVSEITDDYVSLNQQDSEHKIWVSLDWSPESEDIANLLERSMDDLKGEALSTVIEVVVKKLNKLRTFIESIKGL